MSHNVLRFIESADIGEDEAFSALDLGNSGFQFQRVDAVGVSIDEQPAGGRIGGIRFEHHSVDVDTFDQVDVSAHEQRGELNLDASTSGAEGKPSLQLNRLPAGVVAGNTLIDYSATNEGIRGAMSMALSFASQLTNAKVGKTADSDDWQAAYRSNLQGMGFNVEPSAFVRSSFKKQNVEVHKAIIPFLTIALGGAAVGPIIIKLLENLSEVDKDQPWITLFDRETRRYDARELHFAAVASDASITKMRHVVARLAVKDTGMNILFFKINEVTAKFESATTPISIDSNLLATIEKPLFERIGKKATDFIMEAKTI